MAETALVRSWGGKAVYGANARAYQHAMYTRAKQIAPSIAVLGLTTTTAAGARAVGDLSFVMDAGTLHPYPDGDVPTAYLAPIQTALAPLNAAKKPWWVTETGYHTAPNATQNLYQPGVSDAAQAKYIARIYLDYFAAGIPYTSVYELIDEHDEPGGEHGEDVRSRTTGSCTTTARRSPRMER